MKKKALWKNVFREILSSKTRFLSIFAIILLGVSFFAGLQATGPDMQKTADVYFKKQHLMDNSIISTMGLTDDDLTLVQQAEFVETAEGWQWQDMIADDEGHLIRFFSYNEKKQKLNQYVVDEGHLPKKSGEIALDSSLKNTFKIGSTFTLPESNDSESLKEFEVKEFKVVGYVKSPLYIENFTRGNSAVGKGTLDGFGVVLDTDLSMEVYPTIYVTYKNMANAVAYSDNYTKLLEENQKKLEQLLKERPEDRLAEIKAEANEKITEANKEIADGEAKLNDGETQIEEGRSAYNEGLAKYQASESSYNQEIQSNETLLAEKRQALTQAKAQYEEGKKAFGAGYESYTSAAEKYNQEKTKGEEAVASYQSVITQLQSFANLDDETFANQQVVINGTLNQILATLAAANPALPLVFPQSDVTKADLLGNITVLQGASDAISNQLATALAEIQKAQQTLNEKDQALKAAANTIASGEAQLNAASQELARGKVSGREALAAAKAQLDASLQTLTESEATFATEKAKAEKELAEAKEKVTNSEADVAKLTAPDYYYSERADNSSYTEYRQNSERIANIANVFPVFFFMIAALVTLSTMARMVDEQRQQIGTLKALGYTNREVAYKFLVYATVASMTGAILGLALGNIIFPSVIYDAYGILYNLPALVLQWYPVYTVISIVIALLCTVVTAWLVLRYQVRQVPAVLMLPPAPKSGQRILLERIKFIWKRLNFFQKVTARNLFRYKQRMIMTVFGIAGCMALMITGFGLRDSISDIITLQFDKLWHYQAIVTLEDNLSQADKENYEKALASMPEYDESLTLAASGFDYYKKGVTTQNISLYVPESTEKLGDYILFDSRKTGEEYQLTDDGVIINEKLANLYHVNVGDNIQLTDVDKHVYEMKIAAISENYAGHYVYMTPTYYQKIFNKAPVYNRAYLKLKEKPKNETEFSEKLMSEDGVLNVSFLSDISDNLDDTLQSLNIIVWVLIISAAALAVIVLYNLTNINISERIRELSTIKVLGFYDKEVTAYIYRENTILTIFGILFGALFGKFLHGFVLQAAEVDMVMFVPNLHLTSFAYSAILTLIFSGVVMVIMHMKLKKVNMIEALKSNE